jgi:hypothetical protein
MARRRLGGPVGPSALGLRIGPSRLSGLGHRTGRLRLLAQTALGPPAAQFGRYRLFGRIVPEGPAGPGVAAGAGFTLHPAISSTSKSVLVTSDVFIAILLFRVSSSWTLPPGEPARNDDTTHYALPNSVSIGTLLALGARVHERRHLNDQWSYWTFVRQPDFR